LKGLQYAEQPKPLRNFDSAPGLSDETRQAVNAAFDALSNWRTETINASERNIEQVIEKTAAAARALGWPEQIIDTTREQFQTIIKMQTQMMDQIMDAWEEQIKSPNPSSAMLSKLDSLQNFSWANSGAAQMAAMNPMQFYMQFAQQWQKSWAEAMAFWSKARS
jgi:hypothetical protein